MAPPWSILALSAAVLVVSLKPEYSIQQSYLWTALSFLAVTTFCQFVYRCVLYPDYLSPLRDIPTPKNRSWIKGNSRSIFLEVPTDRARLWTKEIPNDGLIRYYMAGNVERIMVTGPKALSEVLVSKVYDFPKSESLRIKLLRFTGNGLLLAEGDEHRAQRKGLMPSFAYRHIKDLYPTFWSKAVEMADAIEKQLQSSSSDVIQVRGWAHRATLDIIGVAGMGRDFGAIQDPDNTFCQQHKKLRFEPTTFTKWLVLISTLTVGFKRLFQLPTKWNRASMEAADYIRGVAREIVHEKKEKMQQGDKGKDKDIASIALTSGVFSDENLVDQMITFLVAGHETIATAMQWAVYALCKHPEMQTRLREEIRSHLPATIALKEGKNPQPATAAEVDSLPYLNAFCNEVLRFYPPVRSTGRQARTDTSILGHHIPKGTLLLLVPGATNLDTDLWGPNAEEFNPERWIGEGRANSGGADTNYAFLTFLHGPRSCIGQSFAKSELACLVAVLVGRFEMELLDPMRKLKVTNAVTSSPKDGVMVKLTCLGGW